ncbi:MAG: hypothetical protein LBE76_03650 [Nitrososphaerota archaeon]|jgi:IS1 family transposase|nr:hypothetical protein [Nitrososphaerota archaeon]
MAITAKIDKLHNHYRPVRFLNNLCPSKSHTVVIEQNNSSMCHHLGRFTRRTKVVSKCDTMVDTSLKLWKNLTTPDIFTQIQTIALISL